MEPAEVKLWEATYGKAVANAKWLARATYEANNQITFPFRDSEAERWKG